MWRHRDKRREWAATASTYEYAWCNNYSYLYIHVYVHVHVHICMLCCSTRSALSHPSRLHSPPPLPLPPTLPLGIAAMGLWSRPPGRGSPCCWTMPWLQLLRLLLVMMMLIAELLLLLLVVVVVAVVAMGSYFWSRWPTCPKRCGE